VQCGTPIEDQQLLIVDPSTRQIVPDGAVGEIWLRGPSVALGYWARPSETQDVFRARLAAEQADATYLRTGDLGQIVDGSLAIRGRIKDVLIVRGMKFHPHDLEALIQDAHPEIKPGGYCAVLQSGMHPDSVDVVAELAREHRKCDPAALSSGIRALIAKSHGVRVGRVVLLPPGRFPKTSSGKVPRRAIAEQFLGNP
jgi:acyl-CoA synthetase (AMP-forming)/AMP-acid ligase II